MRREPYHLRTLWQPRYEFFSIHCQPPDPLYDAPTTLNGHGMLYLEISFVLFLIVLNGVFAMSELAIVSAKKVHLKRLADEGRKAAIIALNFAQDTGRFLPTVQIGITLIGVLSGAFSGATLSKPLTAYLVTLGLAGDTAEVISVSGIVVSITYLTLIIGELVPKELALRNPERMAMFVAPIIYWLSRLTSPLVSMLDFSCKMVLKLIGAGQKPITTVTEEEVRSMIAEGTQHGLFQEAERDMISGIMLLSDKPIRAFMLPRTDVISVTPDVTREEMRALLAEYHYSRYPVKQGYDIVGIVQTKEILNQVLAGGTWDLAALTQPVAAFPDSMPTLKMIEYLRTSPIHMAILTDEHGSFTGIVTLTDLVEVITGELYAPNNDAADMVKREDGSWLMDAGVVVEIAFQKLGLPTPPEETGYHTLAGFMLHCMAYIPKAGDYFEYKNHRFEVADMDGMRIDKALITPALPVDSDEQE